MIKLHATISIIIKQLQYFKNKGAENDCQILVITLFDKEYPNKWRNLIWYIPIIYYYGDLKYLQRSISGFLHTASPSFYAQKVISELMQKTTSIKILIHNNDTYIVNKYDIIYTDKSDDFAKYKCRLVISFFDDISNYVIDSMLILLLDTIYIIEGFATKYEYKIVNDCLDIGINIFALPTNIYYDCGRLPNQLIHDGATPILKGN